MRHGRADDAVGGVFDADGFEQAGGVEVAVPAGDFLGGQAFDHLGRGCALDGEGKRRRAVPGVGAGAAQEAQAGDA